MDRPGDHIDNKFGGCDVPYNLANSSTSINYTEAFNRLTNAANQASETMVQATFAFQKMAQTLAPAIESTWNTLVRIGDVVNKYPNKRVKHLCKYGYGRTRKKNINRMIKILRKEIRKK